MNTETENTPTINPETPGVVTMAQALNHFVGHKGISEDRAKVTAKEDRAYSCYKVDTFPGLRFKVTVTAEPFVERKNAASK